jgi:hypothetical protein
MSGGQKAAGLMGYGKAIVAVAAFGALAACAGGGGPARVAAPGGPVVQFASGPISAACNRSDRPRANRRLCGCAQAVADTTLTGADQSLAASFFKDLDLAQEVRQSDRPSNEAFWGRYKVFIAQTERYCASHA